MTNSASRNRLPASLQPQFAPNVFFSTPAQRVGLARQRFFDEGTRPTGLVPDAVIQSWTRCTQARRNPSESISFTPVTRSRVSHTLERNRLLLEAGRDELQQLQAMLAGTGCKAILTDANCMVVHASPTERKEGELIWLAGRVGVDLSEGCVGTTAPGMVAISGRGCAVHGAEHYFNLNHALACAAAPIRDARGDMVAVLDLSCETRAFQFDAAALVHLFATAIENRLLRRQSAAHVLLRFQASATLLHTPLEGLAALNEMGHIEWMNAAARSLLCAPGESSAATDVEQVIGLNLAQLAEVARGDGLRAHRLPNGLTLCLQVQWPGGSPLRTTRSAERMPPAQEHPASTPAHIAATEPAIAVVGKAKLRDADLRFIESTLAACGGNVSRTARELGVSRGLIYRRLHKDPDAAA